MGRTVNPRRRPKRPRNPYRGSRAFDASCRNHGGCPWCEGNRLAAAQRGLDAATAQMLDGLDWYRLFDAIDDIERKEALALRRDEATVTAKGDRR